MSHLYCFRVETVSKNVWHSWVETCVLYQIYIETMFQCCTKGNMFCDKKCTFRFLSYHYVTKTVSTCITFYTDVRNCALYITTSVLRVTSMKVTSRTCIENVWYCAQYSRFYVQNASKLTVQRWHISVVLRCVFACLGVLYWKMSHRTNLQWHILFSAESICILRYNKGVVCNNRVVSLCRLCQLYV